MQVHARARQTQAQAPHTAHAGQQMTVPAHRKQAQAGARKHKHEHLARRRTTHTGHRAACTHKQTHFPLASPAHTVTQAQCEHRPSGTRNSQRKTRTRAHTWRTGKARATWKGAHAEGHTRGHARARTQDAVHQGLVLLVPHRGGVRHLHSHHQHHLAGRTWAEGGTGYVAMQEVPCTHWGRE
jgi:hypothetical protein